MTETGMHAAVEARGSRVKDPAVRLPEKVAMA